MTALASCGDQPRARATALTVGLRPSRAREKITSGMVVDPGPDKNAASTTSSREIVKVSSQADIEEVAQCPLELKTPPPMVNRPLQ